MKIVIAPDKFKGSLTGKEFCNIVAEVIKEYDANIEIKKIPLADGGDGTIDVLKENIEGEIHSVVVKNPFFKPVKATYFYIPSLSTAYIEMAEASGMKLLKKNELNCKKATTFGTGELILDAINIGAKTIVLGIGGSATNDAGIGMAHALGYRFLDIDNKELMPIGENLINIHRIDKNKVDKRVLNITFKVANDVKNPLFGKQGAAYIYAAQKGAKSSEIKHLDQGLRNINNLFISQFGINAQNIKGAGSGGGMGAGVHVFLNANMSLGIELIKEIIQFDKKIKNADWIITGEGSLDQSSFYGKTIMGIVTSAKQYNIPIAALCGIIKITKENLKEKGITYSASLVEETRDIEKAIKNPRLYLKIITKKLILNFIQN